MRQATNTDITQDQALDPVKEQTSADDQAQIDQIGRGRQAVTPLDIPRRGWRDILIRSWHDITSKNLGIVAAGVAFYALLAIFPGLGAMVSLYGLVANPSDIRHLTDITASFIPGEANSLLVDQLNALVSRPSGNLTLAAAGSILLALWSAHNGITTFMTALNIAYGETEQRGFIARNALAIGLTFGAVVFIILALVLVAILPAIIHILPLPPRWLDFIALIRWPILAVFLMAGIAALYRLGPSRQRPQWRWVSVGSLVATVLWVLGSIGFSLYVTRFGSYNKTYGSLGAVIVLLMWLYFSSYFILIGAQINAEAEHQTAKDTTSGPEKPMGERDAFVADTVGRST
jgi:membrane protein